MEKRRGTPRPSRSEAARIGHCVAMETVTFAGGDAGGLGDTPEGSNEVRYCSERFKVPTASTDEIVVFSADKRGFLR
jgi:hypothetical protein